LLNAAIRVNQDEMSRKVWLWICASMGLALLGAGLLLPAYLRAVDARVLRQAGRTTPGLLEQGAAFVEARNLGGAQLCLAAARRLGLAGTEKLSSGVESLQSRSGPWQVLGAADARLEALFPGLASAAPPATNGPEPITEFLVRRSSRERVLSHLATSTQPAVRGLLRYRTVTNTVLFTPSASASGQALDTAISLCGLVLESGRLSPALSNAVSALVENAGRGAGSQLLEDLLMDLMSLGQRFNWGQLTVLLSSVQSVDTVQVLSHFARSEEAPPSILFGAVQLSGQPAGVGRYLLTYSQSGWADLEASLRFGAGSLRELLARNQRIYTSRHESARDTGQADASMLNRMVGWAALFSLRLPGSAVAAKWLAYLVGGFLLALTAHLSRPAATVLERPLLVPGFHLAREILFALGFLLVVLLVSEPYLAQESQKVEFPFRLRLSMVGGAIPALAPASSLKSMNSSLLTLLLFFVLQGLLYTTCVFKLAEIRRQRVPSRVKLRLLENEDHLFDAGLYLGFAGTIICLILVSLQVMQNTLMAAYSSTSFGIVFVSIFKIFHLRPARRTLLMEAEQEAGATTSGAAEAAQSK
jgi:hypothetical protein